MATPGTSDVALYSFYKATAAERAKRRETLAADLKTNRTIMTRLLGLVKEIALGDLSRLDLISNHSDMIEP